MTGFSRLFVFLCGVFLTSAAFPEGDAAAGAVKAQTCLGCHGIDGYKNVYPTYKVPKLAGQNADYIVVALKAYQSGERSHVTMRSQAETLSDQDMQDIAAYLSAFPGGQQ